MNENLQPTMSTIKSWVLGATSRLSEAGISSAKLDAELILAHTLNKSRTYLHMYGDAEIDPRRKDIADARLQLRVERIPLAYITSHKEFYGRRFIVTPATLIPRPESETIINMLHEHLDSIDAHLLLVDIGTGSGCLGITAKCEFPALEVALLDIDTHALAVAKKNATQLSVDVSTYESNLLSSYPLSPDIVLANLPYVDPSWERSPETDHEPSQALFAKDNGIELISRLLQQGTQRFSEGTIVFLEADPRQHASIVGIAVALGYVHARTIDFIVELHFRKFRSF